MNTIETLARAISNNAAEGRATLEAWFEINEEQTAI